MGPKNVVGDAFQAEGTASMKASEGLRWAEEEWRKQVRKATRLTSGGVLEVMADFGCSLGATGGS